MRVMAPWLQRRWPRYALALGFGLLTTLGFAPFHYLALMLPALLGLLWLWSDAAPRQAFWTGFWFGVGYFGLGFYWVVISTYVYGGAPIWVSLFLLFLLICYTSLFPALAGYCSRRWPLPAPFWAVVQVPALWVLCELLRGWLFTGFPWLSLGYAVIDTPLSGLAPVVGVYGVSGALMLVIGALLGLCISDWRGRGLSVVALLVLISGLVFLPKPGGWTQAVGTPVSVGLVQGNVAQEDKWKAGMLRPTAKRYMTLTEELPEDTRLIIWPEAAIPALYHHVKDPFFDDLQRWAEKRQTTVLGGILREREDGRIINTHFPVGLDAGSMYIKRHLVPFGEYFPVPDFLRLFMQGIHLNYEDIAAGPNRQPLVEVAGLKLGVSICFEDVFGRDIRRDLPGADVLVNVTNDAWFADSTAPHQHLQIARMRALETGRPLLRVSNRGVSGHIGADGQLVARTGFLTTEWLFTQVAAHRGITPYVRWGERPLWGLGLGCLLLSLLLRRR